MMIPKTDNNTFAIQFSLKLNNMEDKDKGIMLQLKKIGQRLDMLEFYSVSNEYELARLVDEAKRLSKYIVDKGIREKCLYEFGQTYINRVIPLENAKKTHKSRAYGLLISNFRGAFMSSVEEIILDMDLSIIDNTTDPFNHSDN